MQKLCTQERQMQRKYGVRMAEEIKKRLAELEAAQNLEDMKYFPHIRCHELTGNRKGQLAVDLVHPHRLILQPEPPPGPRRPDGGLDRRAVECVCIIEIVDYH